eukprot:XP_011680852.1 PREDICTED: low-density lipoprotein receptor-related protein 4-like [Strongylocentrotus purpuratus]
MDRLKQFVMFILVTLHLFISPSSCTDKLFVADAYNATILLAETDGLSFVNSSFNRLPFTGLELPAGVEFDPRTEIVYWTDASLHTVNRAALNGSMQQVIAQLDPISIPANFEYPYGIALNLDENKVYWADQYHDVIEMADLDGSNREDLISTGFNTYAAGIVYSTIRKKIFWTEQGPISPKIEMVNPDGTGREVLIDSDLGKPHGICLDMAGMLKGGVQSGAGPAGGKGGGQRWGPILTCAERRDGQGAENHHSASSRPHSASFFTAFRA